VRLPLLAAGVLAAAFTTAICGLAVAQDEMPKDQTPPPGAKGAQQVPPALPNTGAPPASTGQEPSALPPGTMLDEPMAMLQALDKVTARVRKLPIKVGQAGVFGTLSVLVDACRKAPPEDPPESAAFLEITDRRGDKPQLVFKGWMFASSPALSAMDHPVYDISVVDCTSDTIAPASAASASPAPAPVPATKPAPAH